VNYSSDAYFDFIETLDLVILSDYGKGLFYFNDLTQDLIKKCKISIVDPKDGNLDKWKGCTIFKPNLKEALSLSGKNTVEEAGNYLLGYLGCQAVVITESENGVSVFDASGFTKISPDKKSIKVESVCGAGDCYTAFLGMALCRGLNIQEAAQVAWEAGKRYVQNKYNKPLFPIDFSSGIVDDPEILSKRDFNLVVANGCFDLGLTEAHVKLFEFAKSQGNKLCVCVNSDESMARIKRKAILPLKERMAIVAANKFVDYVVSFEENTPLELFRKIKPNLIVKGGDYKPEDVAGYGLFPVKIFPLVSSMSTTEKIKAAAKNGYWMLIDRLFHGP
jgi:D-beta-D-heptose 7-phosphate kinase/D-beta-D-heptose 1-phosphate adenosyltransferase